MPEYTFNRFHFWRCENGTWDILDNREIIRENVPAATLAAAPDLLAALEQAEEWARQYEDADMDEWTRTVLDSACAAIRKAKGE